MRFTIALPASRPESVGATVRAIRAQTLAAWELLVVGQGEDRQVKAAVEAAAESDRRVRYVHIERRGSSRARTAALRAATGEIVAMTDDDCEPRPDWLAVIDAAFRRDPGLALVGGSMVAPPRRGRWPASCPSFVPVEAIYDPVRSPHRPPNGWDWIGANFALWRSVAERVGDFDPCLGVGGDFPAAGDTDYKLRMEAIGLRMLSTPRARVDHTFGWRYGIGPVLHHQRTHARGNGALAAKLTLNGDGRGRAWLRQEIRQTLSRWVQQRRPDRLVPDLRVLCHFADAYQACRRHYAVDARGLLVRRSSAASAEPVLAPLHL